MLTYIAVLAVIGLVYYLAIWTLRHEGRPLGEQSGLFAERATTEPSGSSPTRADARWRHRDRSGQRRPSGLSSQDAGTRANSTLESDDQGVASPDQVRTRYRRRQARARHRP